MQPGGIAPLEIRNSPPPGNMPGNFLKYGIVISAYFMVLQQHCWMIYLFIELWVWPVQFLLFVYFHVCLQTEGVILVQE